MWKLAISLVLAGAATPSFAANWRLAVFDKTLGDRSLYFVDTSSEQRVGETVRFWHRAFFETPLANESDLINAVADLDEANCTDHSLTTVIRVFYEWEISRGTDSQVHQPILAVPDSNFDRLIVSVCTGKFLSGRIKDPIDFARKSLRRNKPGNED